MTGPAEVPGVISGDKAAEQHKGPLSPRRRVEGGGVQGWAALQRTGWREDELKLEISAWKFPICKALTKRFNRPIGFMPKL